MTMITRWDPFREMATLQDRMNRLFQDFGRGNEELMTAGSFVPPVDIYEDEHSITVKMEIPGIDEKDLDIRLENSTLTVRGERKFEKEEKEENFQRIERRYGSFTRSFTLPNTVDTENVDASYDNGILKLRLAKRAEARPKQIKVNFTGKTLEGKGKAA
jgi:HSP20 family protein